MVRFSPKDCTSATEAGRPTVMGSIAPGKITVSRTVSTGNSSPAGSICSSSGMAIIVRALLRFQGPHGGRGVAAIDGYHLACDVIGAASREEHGQRRDVLRRT